MGRLLPIRSKNPLIILVAVVLLTITVGVVVYQVIGGEEAIPGSAGGFNEPNARSGQVGSNGLETWANAAAVGDYAAAQRVMDDNPLLSPNWKRRHDRYLDQITKYDIIEQQTVGQTTTAVVRFHLNTGEARCIEVMLDEVTQRIFTNASYYACPTQ